MTLNHDPRQASAGANAEGGDGLRWLTGLARGLRRTCPGCGRGKLFLGYVQMQQSCKNCGLVFEPYRADDAPAYFTIFAVGHVVVPSMLLLEQTLHPATWVHMVMWVPLTLGLTAALLPRIKGAVVGVQWGLNVRN